MQLLELPDMAEFDMILRRNHLSRSDFSLTAVDTTDPKTDEIPGLQGELTVICKSTGKAKQYLISDVASWLDQFRHDVSGGAFAGLQGGGNRAPSGPIAH